LILIDDNELEREVDRILNDSNINDISRDDILKDIRELKKKDYNEIIIELRRKKLSIIDEINEEDMKGSIYNTNTYISG